MWKGGGSVVCGCAVRLEACAALFVDPRLRVFIIAPAFFPNLVQLFDVCPQSQPCCCKFAAPTGFTWQHVPNSTNAYVRTPALKLQILQDSCLVPLHRGGPLDPEAHG